MVEEGKEAEGAKNQKCGHSQPLPPGGGYLNPIITRTICTGVEDLSLLRAALPDSFPLPSRPFLRYQRWRLPWDSGSMRPRGQLEEDFLS